MAPMRTLTLSGGAGWWALHAGLYQYPSLDNKADMNPGYQAAQCAIEKHFR